MSLLHIVQILHVSTILSHNKIQEKKPQKSKTNKDNDIYEDQSN